MTICIVRHPKEEDRTEAARAHYERGEAARLAFQHEDALAFLGEGLALSRALEERALEADCLLGLSLTCQQSSDFAACLSYAAEGLALRRALGDSGGEAALLLRIGTTHYNLSDFPAALNSYQEAQRVTEAAGDERQTASALMGIGLMFGEMNRHEEEMVYLTRALTLCRKIGDRNGELYNTCNLGRAYASSGRHAEALEANGAVIALARTLGERGAEAVARNNRGESLHIQGRLPEAETEIKAALALSREIASPSLESDFLCRLGSLYADWDRPEAAREALLRAATLAEGMGARQTLYEAHKSLARVYAQSGDFAAAYAHHQDYHRIERDVFSEEADRRTKTLLAQQEAEAARQETERHRLQNVDLAAMNYALNLTDAENQRLLTELRAQAQELARQAAEDSLTKLPNRRSLDDTLARHFAGAVRHGRPLCVALLDVDHFKQVNDRFSHQAGDTVLQTVAGLIRRACRASDLVGRWGGEEFALTLPDTDAPGARVVCEAVRRAVEAHAWHEIHPDLAVTVSLGLAEMTGTTSHERLLAQADMRLYEAKRAGRNRVAG